MVRTQWTMVVALGAAMLAAAGCHHKDADTTPDTTTTSTTGDDQPPPARDESANMIPPDKMDEVNQNLKRKEMIVSHCMASAMELGQVPRGTHGHIRFEIKIGTGGHATDVSVATTDVKSPEVLECAKKHVMETEFPTLSQPYETSYAYAMEAN